MFGPGSFYSFVVRQVFCSNLPYPKASYNGKIVIVTGANVGLGYEAAKQFVRLDALKVVLAVRSVEKGENAKRQIVEETGCRADIVTVRFLDLSKYHSVQSFVEWANELDRVDVLLENAGLATEEFRLAEEDESTIKVNVLSTFLLGILMLPKLRQTAANYRVSPSLTIVSSLVHHWINLDEIENVPSGKLFDYLSDPRRVRMGQRYNVSKLLEVFSVRQMAKLHPIGQEGTAQCHSVIINCVNPGSCRSEITREAGLAMNLAKLALARSTEMGSRTLVHAASAGPETHGQYLSECHVEMPNKVVTSDKGVLLQQRIWEEMNDRLAKAHPELLDNP